MKKIIHDLWASTRPLTVIGSIFLYFMGGGIARYLGKPLDEISFFLGLGVLVLLIFSGYFLNAYYAYILSGNHLRKENVEEKDKRLNPVIFLQSAITFLSIAAVLVVLLITRDSANFLPFLFILLILLVAILYAVPPFRLSDSGYGELCEAFLATNLSPALAFLIQTGEVHRLLAMLTFPLTFIFLALVLTGALPTYATDLKFGKKNLMIRLGWMQGMNLHNFLIIAAYILLVLDMLMGLPWKLTWPSLLSIPIAVFQIVLMIGISRGGKPNWNLLSLTSVTTFLLTAYLLTFSLWIQ